MSKLQLRYYPDEVLLQETEKVTRFDTSVRKLAQDMLDTMYANNGVGLAAPQVGVSKRIMVIDVSAEEEPKGDLLCRAIQHEIDHLDGEVFIDKAVSPLVAEIELSKHGFGADGTGVPELDPPYKPIASTTLVG